MSRTDLIFRLALIVGTCLVLGMFFYYSNERDHDRNQFIIDCVKAGGQVTWNNQCIMGGKNA